MSVWGEPQGEGSNDIVEAEGLVSLAMGHGGGDQGEIYSFEEKRGGRGNPRAGHHYGHGSFQMASNNVGIIPLNKLILVSKCILESTRGTNHFIIHKQHDSTQNFLPIRCIIVLDELGQTLQGFIVKVERFLFILNPLILQVGTRKCINTIHDRRA